MEKSKPYDDTATAEQQSIIRDFFKGYTVKQLVSRYRETHKKTGASGRPVMISMSEAYHIIGEALLHISWV